MYSFYSWIRSCCCANTCPRRQLHSHSCMHVLLHVCVCADMRAGLHILSAAGKCEDSPLQCPPCCQAAERVQVALTAFAVATVFIRPTMKRNNLQDSNKFAGALFYSLVNMLFDGWAPAVLLACQGCCVACASVCVWLCRLVGWGLACVCVWGGVDLGHACVCTCRNL